MDERSVNDEDMAMDLMTSAIEKTLHSTTKKALLNTRQLSLRFGLGNKITVEDSVITGSRLPTSLQVLRCLMYHIQSNAKKSITKWESAKLVLEQVKIFYEKANIPIITERKACEKLLKL